MDELFDRLRTALGDRYEIIRLIGEGGMARVYLARDLRHERQVALKVLRPEVGASLGADRFLREIRIVAGLQHPNIVPLFDSGASGSSPAGTDLLWYVMPYVPGESLRARLEREGRLSLAEAVRIGDDLAGALDYAHARGVVHRDVKPENVLLSDGHAFVADFGVARAVDVAGAHGATATGIAMGTPAYMSPEQASGLPDLDGRSDVYSLACVLYEMLAGAAPFGGATAREIMAKHAVHPIPSLRRERPDLAPPIEAALEWGLAKAPDARATTAVDLLRGIRGPEEGRALTTPVPPMVVPRRRGWVVPAALAGAALLAAALVWRVRSTAEDVVPAPSASALAVLPFTVRGTDSLGLGQGLVGLLGTKLDGAGDLHTVDSRALLSYVSRQAQGPLGPEQGRGIADHFGAGLFVLGDVLTVGDRLRLTASLYDTRRPGHPAATASAEGPTDKVFELVDSLAGQLVAGWSGRESRLTALAAVTTRSLSALKAYLDGETAFRAGNFDAAVEGFQRAVAQDSLFALAWYRMSVAAEWLTRSDIAHDAAEHAVRLADRLSEHDRLLLKGLVATRRGDALEAERLFQNIVAIYPNDVEAWVQLGEVQFHYGPLLGRPIADSKATWQRVLTLQPNFFAPLVHLARIAASEKDRVQVDSLVRRALALRAAAPRDAGATRSEALELEALRAFSLGDTAAQSRVLAALDSATDVTVDLSLWGIASFVGDREAAARVARILADPSRPPWSRAASHVFQANLAQAEGRIDAARRELDAAAEVDPRAAAEARGLLAAAPYRRPDPTELAAARDAVAHAPDTPEPPLETSVVLSAHHGIHAHLRAYLLGLLDARLGRATSAGQYARELETLPSPSDVGSMPTDLAKGIRAEIASRRDRPAEVTAAFEGVRRQTYYELATTSPFYAQARERFVQAEGLVAQGRDSEAQPLYRSLSGQATMFELPYLAPSQLRLGEIAERQGRADEAAEHYARVVELWRNADAPLQALVREARGRLAKVRGEKSEK